MFIELDQQSTSRKQPIFRDATTGFPPNDVWETSAEIPYWWRVTTQIWVVLLIGLAAWEIWFNQSRKQRALKDQEIALIRNESQATASLLFETNWNALKYVESILRVRNLCTLQIKEKIDSVNFFLFIDNGF